MLGVIVDPTTSRYVMTSSTLMKLRLNFAILCICAGDNSEVAFSLKTMKRVRAEDVYDTVSKCYDRSGTGTLSNTWGLVYAGNNTIFSPSRGTDIDEREGRRVVVKKVKTRFQIDFGSVENASLAALGAEIIGLALVLDHQPNGAAPTPADVFASNEPDAFETLDDLGRYEVLERLILPLNRWNLEYVGSEYKTTSTKHIASFEWATDMLVHFNEQNVGSVVDLVDANLFVVGIKTSTTTGTVTVDMQSRVYFHDV